MKILSYSFLFFALSLPFLVNGQIACENGSELELCNPRIPPDSEVVNEDKTFENITLECFWVCSGDSLTLTGAVECNIFLEPQASLLLAGNANYVWGKSEARVEISAGAFNTTLGILEDVVFIDDGTDTDETICNNLDFNYIFAPEEGCDLTSVDPGLEIASVQIYPNPVNGKASILMTTQESYFGEIFLSDSFGRLVKKWNADGQLTINLPLENTSPGVYLLHVPNTKMAKKIVVF